MVKFVCIILFFFYSVIIVSCKPLNEISSETIRNLNPTEEPLQESIDYDKVKIIKLESSLSCLIGNINRIEMNDSLIFVSEHDKLYTFTLNGKFVAKIGNKGEGPDEYMVLSSFYIDDEKQQVTIIDEFKNALINYDFTGKYVSTVSVPKKTFEGCNYALLTMDNKLLANKMMGGRNKEVYFLFDLKKKEISGRFFSYNPITIGNYMCTFSWHPMSRVDKDIDIIMPLCDTIYTYSAESSVFQPRYIVETPQKMASKDQIRKHTPSYNEDLYKLAERGFFTGFTSIFETDTKVLLETQGVVWSYFLFDKLSKTGHYYLGSWGKEDTILPFYTTIYAYKNAFVGYVSAETLLSLTNIQDDNIRESIKDLKEDDNPCLVLYELK